MKFGRVLMVTATLGHILLLTLVTPTSSAPQEGGFDLPVQLIGFPVIIFAVRLSNFIKKLSYSLNPSTYVARTRRDAIAGPATLDVVEVEKRLVAELGEKVCVFEPVCEEYARRTLADKSSKHVLNWNHVLREYSRAPRPNKENYLLSVFMGDIIASPDLCRQLVKRGRGCKQ